MRTISFTITGQRITGSAISDLVGNTKNYVEASFSFSSEWDGFFKIAIFTANSKQYPAILQNNKCMVPDIAMSGEYMDVGVMAGNNGTVLSTDTFRARIEESVRTKPPYDLITMFDGLSEAIADLQAEDETLDSKIDLKQAKTLESPITIDGVEYATVETAIVALCAHAGHFDSALSDSSENAVQNKVVKAAMDLKQGKTLDTPVEVGGESKATVQAALAAIALALAQQQTIDTSLNTTSTNPVQNKVIAEAVNAKQGKTLDNAITVNGTQYTSLESALGAINTLLAGHIETEVVSTNGVHHFRKDPNSNDLQYYDEQTETWITISTGGGGSVTVDTALSTTSTNPVQNKVITQEINQIISNVTANTTHRETSIFSGAHGFRIDSTSKHPQYYDSTEEEWKDVEGIHDVDSSFSTTSTNPVQNKVVKGEFDAVAHDITDILEAEFENLYGICSKTTTIATNQQGNKVITESDATHSVTAVTTIEHTSQSVTTITTVITPSNLDTIYTKTTTITKSSSGTSISESYATASPE